MCNTRRHNDIKIHDDITTSMLMWRHIKYDDVTMLLWFMINQKAAPEANLNTGKQQPFLLSGKQLRLSVDATPKKYVIKQYFCERI